MRIIRVDLFSLSPRYIAHGVNCEGIAAAGFAGALRRRLSGEVYRSYEHACAARALRLGGFVRADIAHGGRPVTVYHLATQPHPGRCARLGAVASAVAAMLADTDAPEIHLPWLGCGIGGLDRADVAAVLRDLDQNDRLVICSLD